MMLFEDIIYFQYNIIIYIHFRIYTIFVDILEPV